MSIRIGQKTGYRVSEVSLGSQWVETGISDELMGAEKAKEKAYNLLKSNESLSPVSFSEFGTRRRRSYHVQQLVMRGLMDGHEQAKREAEASGKVCGSLSGSSNVRPSAQTSYIQMFPMS